MKTKGWQKVFSFTFVQYVKTKSFIVGTIIICILSAAICVLTNVLPAVMFKGEFFEDDGSVGSHDTQPFLEKGTVYLYDEAEILTEDDRTMLAEMFGERFSVPERSLEDTVNELTSSEDIEAAVRITAARDGDGGISSYEVRSYYSSPAKSSVDTLGSVMSELVNRRIMLNAGVSPDKYADTKISVFASKTEAGSKNLNAIQGMVNYAVPLVISLVLFMLVFAYGQIVAQSIATEKTSRVMELLLTSVRPLAVVIGKVLAMGLVSFLQFFLIVFVGWISVTVSAPFGWMGRAMELIKDPEIQALLSQAGQSGGLSGVSIAGVSSSELDIAQTVSEFTKMITPLNIAAVIITFLLGFLVFALVAALVGASISRMEDLQAAMGPYSMIGVLGMYLAYFPVIFNMEALESGDASVNPVQMFSYFFPISSPFALPSAILLGTLEPWQIFVSIGVLALSVALIAMIVGKVYEAIILHNGNRIKLGDIIKMAVRK